MTEHFNRVLVLWLDLQNVLQRSGYQNKSEDLSNCADPAVREAWQNITHPRNALALEQLFYQLADPTQLELTRQALQTCRNRRDAPPASLAAPPAN